MSAFLSQHSACEGDYAIGFAWRRKGSECNDKNVGSILGFGCLLDLSLLQIRMQLQLRDVILGHSISE